jgi:hypothetical protein
MQQSSCWRVDGDTVSARMTEVSQMDESDFEKPVRILVGLGYMKEIASVMDAYSFLNEWVAIRHMAEHAAALKACKAALAGTETPETACALFKAFAARQHLLAPESEAVVAARAKRDVRRPDASA